MFLGLRLRKVQISQNSSLISSRTTGKLLLEYAWNVIITIRSAPHQHSVRWLESSCGRGVGRGAGDSAGSALNAPLFIRIFGFSFSNLYRHQPQTLFIYKEHFLCWGNQKCDVSSHLPVILMNNLWTNISIEISLRLKKILSYVILSSLQWQLI